MKKILIAGMMMMTLLVGTCFPALADKITDSKFTDSAAEIEIWDIGGDIELSCLSFDEFIEGSAYVDK